jgi:hypothetical protein
MKARICSLFLAALTTNAAVAAVVTSGFYRVSHSEGVFEMSGEGPAFSFKGWFYHSSSAFPYGQVDPGWVDAGAAVTGGDLGGGSALLAGTEVGMDFATPFPAPVGSAFWFTGSALVTGPGQATGPFEFTGSLCGSVAGFPCLLALPELTGKGTVVLDIQNIDGALGITRATYIFAVPEPSTVLLVIATLAGVLAARKRMLWGSGA